MRLRSAARLLVPALLVLLVAAAYWPGRDGGFAFDDYPNIVDNTVVHVSSLDWRAWSAAAFSSEAGTLQRPLAMLSFAANHALTGLDPVAMKLTNIAIHALNAVLAYALATSLFRIASPEKDSRPRAVFAAAAWGLHPINLMAVLLIVQRMESLSHTFVLAGLWLYLRGRQLQLAGGRGWAIVLCGVIGCTALGLLAKESAALLPLYAFLAEACLFGFARADGGRNRTLVAMYVAILLLPALVGIAWLWPRVEPAYAMRDFTLGERLLTEGRVVFTYLRWILAPDLKELGLYHDDFVVSRGWLQPASTAGSLLAIAALLALAAWLRGRRPLLALGLLWFFAAQLLTATVLPLELMYEHRNYFASFGLCIAVADAWPMEGKRRALGRSLALLVVALLFALTFLRAREWSDPYRFASSEAVKHPHSPRATYSLGQALTVMSRYDRGSPLLPAAFEALERARQVPGAGLLPDSALLLLAAQTGQPQRAEWWEDMRRRIREHRPSPQDVNALLALTRCARVDCRFAVEEMRRTYEVAMAAGPNADIATGYGDYALNVMGDPQLALRLWRQAVDLKPRVAQYRINLVKLLIHLRMDDEARAQIAALRGGGRLGQNELAARELESRLARARAGSHPIRRP